MIYHTEMDSYDKTGVSFFPLQVRTAYAQTLEALQDLQVTNLTADLTSLSLNTKTVSGRQYVYAQGRIADGSAKQVYLGPLDEGTKALMERFNRSKREARLVQQTIEVMGKQLRGAGMTTLDPIEWRVVSALAADGVFRLGGVIVGTVALRCLAGLLGVRLKVASAVTADVDIAGRTLPVGMVSDSAQPNSALERLDMGFSPMADADNALFGSRFQTSRGDFKVEFLTPLTGRDHRRRMAIEQLGVTAIPLRFLDYLIENPVQAIALGRRPILVHVPSPGRYAVHKLIVSRERKKHSPKIRKDLEQSHALQVVLQRLDPESLEEAFEIGRGRGPSWRKRIDAGQEAMIHLLGRP